MQSPEALAAAEKAVEEPLGLSVGGDMSISIGGSLHHISPALTAPAEGEKQEGERAAEHGEVNLPNAKGAAAEDASEGAQPAEAALAAQQEPAATANAPAAEPAQPLLDGSAAPAPAAEGSEAVAAAQRDASAAEGGADATETQGADAATDGAAVAPQAKHASAAADLSEPVASDADDAKHAASSAEPYKGRAKRKAANDPAPDEAPAGADEATAAEAAAAAATSEHAAAVEATGRKKRRAKAAEENGNNAELAIETPAPTDAAGEAAAPEDSAAAEQPAAEPKSAKKRKASTMDSQPLQSEAKPGATPDSLPSRSLSRRSLRSNHTVEDTAAAGQEAGPLAEPPAAEAASGPAKWKSRAAGRAGPAEAPQQQTADATPASRPKHPSNAQKSISRRSLRSQAEPTPKQQAQVSLLPASRRALRSHSSAPREGLVRSAAASPEVGKPAPGGKQHLKNGVSSAAVQALLNGSVSPRRRTRSITLEPEEKIEQTLLEEAAGAGAKPTSESAAAALPAQQGKAPVEPGKDASSASADTTVAKEAAVPDQVNNQANGRSSQPDENTGAAINIPAEAPIEVG